MNFNNKIALVIGLTLLPFSVQAAYSVYGSVHLSGDYYDNGPDTDLLISSNATRIGVKGTESLKYSLKALWKLESEVDITGESGGFDLRNRYIGVISGLGTIVAGYHDTPLRSLGNKVDVMEETIADRRSILGTTSVGENIFDLRAPKAVMYVSPQVAGLEVRLLYSPGEYNETEPANKTRSASAIFRNNLMYIGVAYEDQSRIRNSDAKRLGAGLTLDATEVNVIYEILDSSWFSRYDRVSYGASVSHRLKDTIFKTQIFHAEDETHSTSTGGTMIAAGIAQRLGKQIELYGIVARVENEDLSRYPLAAAEHGETYPPAVIGNNVHAASVGLVYKF